MNAEAHALRMQALAERDGKHCVWCGVLLRTEPVARRPAAHQATADHLVPVSAGGPTWLCNLVPACRRCNQRRSSMSAARFAERCLARGQRVHLELVRDRLDAAARELRRLGEEAPAARAAEDLAAITEVQRRRRDRLGTATRASAQKAAPLTNDPSAATIAAGPAARCAPTEPFAPADRLPVREVHRCDERDPVRSVAQDVDPPGSPDRPLGLR